MPLKFFARSSAQVGPDQSKPKRHHQLPTMGPAPTRHGSAPSALVINTTSIDGGSEDNSALDVFMDASMGDLSACVNTNASAGDLPSSHAALSSSDQDTNINNLSDHTLSDSMGANGVYGAFQHASFKNATLHGQKSQPRVISTERIHGANTANIKIPISPRGTAHSDRTLAVAPGLACIEEQASTSLGKSISPGLSPAFYGVNSNTSTNGLATSNSGNVKQHLHPQARADSGFKTNSVTDVLMDALDPKSASAAQHPVTFASPSTPKSTSASNSVTDSLANSLLSLKLPNSAAHRSGAPSAGSPTSTVSVSSSSSLNGAPASPTPAETAHPPTPAIPSTPTHPTKSTKLSAKSLLSRLLKSTGAALSSATSASSSSPSGHPSSILSNGTPYHPHVSSAASVGSVTSVTSVVTAAVLSKKHVNSMSSSPTGSSAGGVMHPLVPYDSKDLVDSAPPAAPAPAASKKEKLTPEQKQARALAEREKRLQEVLSVLEGRKQLPPGMADLKFSNFIGDGTYGFVVTAWKGAQEVAVKFIFRSKIPSTAWKQDPVLGTVPTEIYHLSTLSHPNLVKLLGYYDDGKEYIIAVTELHGTSWDSANPVLQRRRYEGLRTIPRAQRVGSEGKGDLNTLSSLNAKQREMLRPRVSCDLFECIDAHDYFPERVVRHIFRQVVDVVAYLHQHNIVHRDLKDENIVIDEHYNVKLIDFGSAAEIPTATQPLFDKFLGTMDFAAPEIIEGYKYRGPEVEIWALGVLLYILVFRQIPFKSQQDTVAVNYKKPKELIDYYSGAVELYDLLDQMMVKDANRRARIEEVQNHPWMHMRT